MYLDPEEQDPLLQRTLCAVEHDGSGSDGSTRRPRRCVMVGQSGGGPTEGIQKEKERKKERKKKRDAACKNDLVE